MDFIDQLLKEAAADTVNHLGRTVFVNGIELKCHFNDDEYEDDSGYRRELLLSFLKTDADLVKPGASVVIKGESFTIGRQALDSFDDPFHTVELKRA